MILLEEDFDSDVLDAKWYIQEIYRGNVEVSDDNYHSPSYSLHTIGSGWDYARAARNIDPAILESQSPRSTKEMGGWIYIADIGHPRTSYSWSYLFAAKDGSNYREIVDKWDVFHRNPIIDLAVSANNRLVLETGVYN